jgi:prepilin-type N-terminal cleavage/methylation domain-containing protein
MTKSKQAGFTLVEVLTVIAIIALLAALILGLAGTAQKKAARSKAEAEIGQLESFVTDYQMQYGQVPGLAGDTAEDLEDLREALTDANHSLTNLVDPWGMPYHYMKSSKVTFYLWSLGGDLSNPATNRAVWIGKPAP